MKLGDLFYTRVKDNKLVCFQLYNILDREYITTVKSAPKRETYYSFRRINPITMKSMGNCVDRLTLKDANLKFKPLTDAVKILFTKEKL